MYILKCFFTHVSAIYNLLNVSNLILAVINKREWLLVCQFISQEVPTQFDGSLRFLKRFDIQFEINFSAPQSIASSLMIIDYVKKLFVGTINHFVEH